MNRQETKSYALLRFRPIGLIDFLKKVEHFMLTLEPKMTRECIETPVAIVVANRLDQTGYVNFYEIPSQLQDNYNKVEQSFIIKLENGREPAKISFIVANTEHGLNPESVAECVCMVPVSLNPETKSFETFREPMMWLALIRRFCIFLETQEGEIYDDELPYSLANFEGVPDERIIAPYTGILYSDRSEEEKWSAFKKESGDDWQQRRKTVQNALGYTAEEILSDYRSG